MRGKWILAATALVSVSISSGLQAQSIALLPFAGYGLPGKLAQDDPNEIELKPNGALLLGVQIELGMSKNLGIDVGVNRTFSQKLDEMQSGSSFGTDDFSMTQITGSLVLRPGGRRPNGSVTPLFIEIGGGVTLYKIGSAALSNGDFNSTQPMGFAGLGFNVPIGPRATLQLFGRAQMIGPYSSSGLDDFNAIPPATNIEGKAMLNFQVGGALRVGR